MERGEDTLVTAPCLRRLEVRKMDAPDVMMSVHGSKQRKVKSFYKQCGNELLDITQEHKDNFLSSSSFHLVSLVG